MDVPRRRHLRRLTLLLRESPVVALLGARQVGKSTLARQLVAGRRGPTTWFDLENPVEHEDPRRGARIDREAAPPEGPRHGAHGSQPLAGPAGRRGRLRPEAALLRAAAAEADAATALRSVLSSRVREERLHVVSGLGIAEPSTRAARALLEALGIGRSVLIVTAGPDRAAFLSARNLPGVRAVPADVLNVADTSRAARRC